MELSEEEVTLFDTERKRTRQLLATEEKFSIVSGRETLAVLSASPENLKELAVGFLVGSGACTLEDIADMEIKGSCAYLKKELPIKDWVRTTECLDPLERALETDVFVESDIRVSVATIVDALKLLQKNSPTWQKTHGTHSAALFKASGELVSSMEDVSRHNTIDKLLGFGLLSGIDFSKLFVVCTGRITQSMVFRLAHVGVGLAASRTAPINPAVELARRLGVTLVGFASRKPIRVYSHEHRVTL